MEDVARLSGSRRRACCRRPDGASVVPGRLGTEPMIRAPRTVRRRCARQDARLTAMLLVAPGHSPRLRAAANASHAVVLGRPHTFGYAASLRPGLLGSRRQDARISRRANSGRELRSGERDDRGQASSARGAEGRGVRRGTRRPRPSSTRAGSCSRGSGSSGCSIQGRSWSSIGSCGIARSSSGCARTVRGGMRW